MPRGRAQEQRAAGETSGENSSRNRPQHTPPADLEAFFAASIMRATAASASASFSTGSAAASPPRRRMAMRPNRSADGCQRGGYAAGACIPLSSAIQRAHNITAARRLLVIRPVCARKKKGLPFVTWPPYSQGRGRWREKGLFWRRRHAWHACMRAAPLSRRTFPFASLQVCPFPGLARKLRPHARTSYVAVVVRRACPADGGGHRGSGGAWATCVSLVSASAGWHGPGPAAPGVPGPHERGLTTALWQACCRPARASCAWRALWRRHRAAGVPPC